MATRAKLRCVSVDTLTNGSAINPEKTGERLEFETRYDSNDSKEDNSFSKFTPTANMGMTVINPDLFGAFEVGKAYYFDITPCEAAVEE